MLWRITLGTAALAGLWPVSVAQAQSIPDDFVDELVADGFDEPVALAFAPDGRLFVAERGGVIYIIANGAVQEEPFARIEVFTIGESGLLGLAIPDDFLETHEVYCLATVTDESQQIIRIREESGIGTERDVIRDNLPTQGFVHNGGGLRFGPDGMLYFSIGDTGDTSLSQQMHSFAGKVCRINRNGDVPDDNPFLTPTNTPRAVYALGFRNPFRFCFAPDGGLFVGDVGSTGDDRFEEINLVTAGGNYGWPDVEGFKDADAPADYADPLIAYREEGSSIAGCVFYSTGNFPEEYVGDLFHLDFVSQGLFRAKFDGEAVVSHTQFAQLDGGTVDLALGPDGSLYYTEMFTGSIKRVRYTLDEVEDDPLNLTLDDSPEDDDVNDAAPHGPCGAGTMTAMISMMTAMATLRYSRRKR